MTPTPPDCIELKGITKSFGDVHALRGVDITLRPGRVYGLVGENGAGKSTLMHVLFGMHRPDAGVVSIDGAPVQLREPKDAMARGIAMVHQHDMLVPALTVAENLALAPASATAGRFNKARTVADVRRLSDSYALDVAPSARVADLSLGGRQRVEILAALHRRSRLLILDEPTTVLTPPEVDRLLGIIRNVAAEGRTVVVITHKLSEIFAVCDEIAVMRGGSMVGSWDRATSTPADIAEAMVGHALETPAPQTDGGVRAHVPVVEARGMGRSPQDQFDRPGLEAVDIEVRGGEVLGIAGVAGNGQAELVELLIGVSAPDEGTIRFVAAKDQPTSYRKEAVERVAIVPEDRHSQGLVLDMDIAENAMLGQTRRPDVLRGPVIRWSPFRRHTRDMMRTFDVRAASDRVIAGTLSGGNQQKIVLARAIDSHPDLLVVVEPTRGLDFKAAEYVLTRVRQLADEGTAVLYIGSDLDELLAISDRVQVLFRGRLSSPLSADERVPSVLGPLMAGLEPPTGLTA